MKGGQRRNEMGAGATYWLHNKGMLWLATSQCRPKKEKLPWWLPGSQGGEDEFLGLGSLLSNQQRRDAASPRG